MMNIIFTAWEMNSLPGSTQSVVVIEIAHSGAVARRLPVSWAVHGIEITVAERVGQEGRDQCSRPEAPRGGWLGMGSAILGTRSFVNRVEYTRGGGRYTLECYRDYRVNSKPRGSHLPIAESRMCCKRG